MFDKKYDLTVQEKWCITLCYSSQQSCSQHITLEHKVGGGGCNLKVKQHCQPGLLKLYETQLMSVPR